MAKVLAATKEENYINNYATASIGDVLNYDHNREFFNTKLDIGDEVWIRVQGDNHIRLKGRITEINTNSFSFEKIINCDISTRDIFDGSISRPLKAGAEFGWIEKR